MSITPERAALVPADRALRAALWPVFERLRAARERRARKLHGTLGSAPAGLEALPDRAHSLELVAAAGRVDGSLRREQRRQLEVAVRTVDALFAPGASERFPLLVTLRALGAR